MAAEMKETAQEETALVAPAVETAAETETAVRETQNSRIQEETQEERQHRHLRLRLQAEQQNSYHNLSIGILRIPIDFIIWIK